LNFDYAILIKIKSIGGYIMLLVTKTKLISAAMSASLIAAAGGVCTAGIGSWLLFNSINNYTPLSKKLEKAQVDTSEYTSKLAEKRRELYSKLEKGELNINQFRSAYINMEEEYTVEDWAKEQVSNPQIQEIVTQDNKEYEEFRKINNKGAISVATGAGLVVAVAGGASFAISMSKDRIEALYEPEYRKLTKKENEPEEEMEA
jgi:hypothetical protein